MDGRVFKDRREAGLLLAKELQGFRGLNDILVFALPRGGVTVAYEIARALRAPLDVFITHKLRFPGQPELAMGALSERGSVVLNEAIVADVPKQLIDSEITVQREEISRRVTRYRHIDNSDALKPLDRTVAWDRGELPETYPSEAYPSAR